ncbi:AAA family ATPase [Thermococcus waiotapuensis]|uniref:ATP/GTP-binding protein n=1 Tax=Thermococcus waiotapuensis TaxID=90909 RepID=A0AAE4NWY5_9EURY|nr:ATP/GTP-binding protein [Thermococcus waiotapuensis]MDV3104846.1 ATP/GTP-binding protein [Thermococcus waiotapuensis]
MLMITSLTIGNFRGIPKLKLTNLGQINVVVGRNNAGKSSVIEALAVSIAGVNGENDLLQEVLTKILTWRGWFGKNSITSLFYHDQLVADINFVAGNTLFSFEIRKHGNIMDLLDGEFKLDEDTLRRIGLGKFAVIPITVKAGPLKKTYLVLINAEFPEDGELLTIFSTSDNVYPIEMPLRFLTPFDITSHGFIEKVHSWAFKEKRLKSAFSLIKEGYPEFQNLSPLPENNTSVMYVDVQWAKKAVPYYTMGDGFKTLAAMALTVSSLKNGYLLIDSAEAFHHPKSLRVVAKTLLKGAKENNVQVFLTTHSLELIDILLEEGLKENIDGRIIYMKREGGKVEASIETFEESQELRETLGLDLRG